MPSVDSSAWIRAYVNQTGDIPLAVIQLRPGAGALSAMWLSRIP
jgi:hypothetical protein